MNAPQTRLDSFEAALLTELKLVVGESAAAGAAAAPQVRDRWSRAQRTPNSSRWYVPAVASTAAALTLGLIGYGLWPTPAYAVTGRNDGEITVKVNRLEGADGLERALRDHGIAAEVSYLPDGKSCANGRYTEVHTPGLRLSVSATTFEITIPAGSVGADDTFVLSAAVVPLPNGVRASVDFGVAHGPVAACRVVDAP